LSRIPRHGRKLVGNVVRKSFVELVGIAEYSWHREEDTHLTTKEFSYSGKRTVLANAGTVVLKVSTEKIAGVVMWRIEMHPRYPTMLSVPRTEAGTEIWSYKVERADPNPFHEEMPSCVAVKVWQV
jgi:hypothetical protein